MGEVVDRHVIAEHFARALLFAGDQRRAVKPMKAAFGSAARMLAARIIVLATVADSRCRLGRQSSTIRRRFARGTDDIEEPSRARSVLIVGKLFPAHGAHDAAFSGYTQRIDAFLICL